MTTMAPAGEGGGGTTGTTTTTTTTGGNGGGGGSSTSSAEQAPNPAASPATPQHQQQQQQQQQQHPPPSPLSGCYLLVVLPEPHTAQHKDLILNRLAKGFLSWDKDSCHVDLEKELQALVAQAPEGEEARNGERLIQYATENLVTEVLIYPQSNTLLQCIRNLLASFTKHRHIIHAGYTFGGNGSWILQDGTFSLADFLVAFSEHEVQRVLRAYENSVTVDIHCAGVGDWSTSRLSKESCTRACRVRVNPDDVLTAGVPAITSFTNYIGQYLIAQTLDQLMEPSDVVGNIRFSHPTLYVFPGGQGDAALFGINGFNMLVDGGFARKACFWDFTRHLDRLDAVLVTRINNSNVGGMSSVLRKKKEMHVYPQIGHFFCNLVERRHSNSPDGDKDVDPLILNLIDIGQEMMVNLRHINLRPHPCYRDPEPINLYHKVGHGTLNMYVLSPNKDSREVREFLSKWNASDAKLFASSHRKDSNSIIFPVQNLVSICALLVWQPANPEDTITRILFPGSTPQHKIFEGFERLKHLEFLKHPVCTAKSISPSQSLVTLKDKAAILKPKLGSIERETKRLAEVRREKRDVSEIKTVKKDSVVDDTAAKISTGKPIAPIQPKTETKARKVVENKKIESEAKESKIIDKELKDLKKEVKKVEKSERSESETKKTDGLKVETEKTAPIKEPKVQKIDTKKKESKEITKSIVKTAKPESTTKPSIKPIEKKIKSSGEKKDIMKSSPTTPKKSMNGAATKTEISKTVSKSTVKTTSKLSSAAAPAKSAKDANNRMVVEQKNNELSSIASSAGQAKVPAKPKAIERKPISRRTKPISPSKARLPISPAKSTRSTPTASVKSEKDAVIRKVKGGTTDSSAVSTPSGIEPESAIKLIDKNLTEKSEDMSLDSIESKVLADLKEEREVVEEIEAVLQKAERIEEARKEERFDGDDEITAEATDKKEEDMTEEDVTAEMDDVPKKISRKESQEFTEEDEYLIVEKEEIYTEDSMQSGDTEQKHHLDEAESEKTQVRVVREPQEEEDDQDQEEDKDFAEEKKDEIPEKKLVEASEEKDTRKSVDLSFGDKELLKEEMKQIIASATEAVQKTEDKDDSGKRDSEDITKEPSSLSPDKLDSSAKPDVDQKEVVPEKLEESQERISTLESGATTTAPTLPEDERIPLDEIKEDVDEKHVVEDVKEKDVPIKQKEVVPETLPIVTKPEVKVLDVRPPTHHGIARDVVKTPDEVADLPVHEEVDPKLYRMDDLEKDKDTKVPLSFQEVKETPAPSTAPPPKEKDKGVFSFFGKVADKFEKGIDKLTKKTRRDSSDKDTEDKSSKSSSPKEPKPQEKALLEEVDIDKVFPKVGKLEEKPDIFEQAMPQVSDIKVAAIKETASFLQEEIKDTKIKGSEELDILQSSLKSEDIAKDEKLKEQVVEDIEEVEAFVEEASKKFRNAKDSLQDSLESLDDKVDEAAKLAKDTLTGVAEKLGDFDSKEPEKVKFIIPSTEEDLEGEEDDSEGVVRDFKEAVRDVAEVLVGTAGIEIEKEEKPKDVVEVVKKVAEVLKEDDFLSEKVLLSDETKTKDEDKGAKSSPEEAMIPKKVGVTEEFAPQEEVQELLYGGETKTTPIEYEKADGFEIREEPCTKIIKKKDISASSPVRDEKSDIQEAMRLCEDLMKDDIIEQPTRTKREVDTQQDVMDLGLEEVCIKTVTKRVFGDDKEEEEKVVEPEISFEQKLSPGKAEFVTVTPGSTPTSPKLATELGLPELSAEYRDIFNKDTSLESIIEEFIVLKKHKITMQVLEYISIVKCVPKEKVINIIQEIIIKYKIPRESIADNVQILRIHDDISPAQRLEVETYITNEYLNKNKKISLTVIEEISTARKISKRIVIEIVEEIIIKRHASRESVFDITEESYFMILKDDLEKVSETDKTKKDLLVDISDAAGHEITHSPIKEVEETCAESSGIEVDKIVDGFVSISSKDAVEAFLQQERKKSHEESKIVDDFEAVEQEYKVRGVPSLSTTEKLSELKDKETEEVDDVSDVIEADEKFVKETVEKSIKEEHIVDGDLKEKDNKKVEQEQVHDYEISEVSEVDTKEKYLDEAKEKTSSAKETVTSEISDLIKDSQEKIIPGKADTDATGRSDITKVKDLHIDKKDDQDNLIDDLASMDIGQESLDSTVRRMVVTASSEDGGHETEICASGTITFIKTPTPEDSLNITDIKTTSEKDSLILEKDSLRSIGSTPEKDSLMSDKSDHAGKVIAPEDSLEKSSTVGTEPLKRDIIKVDDIKLQELDSKIKETEKLEETLKHSVLPLSDMAKTPDSVHSGDASPAESVFAKSPTEQAFSHQPESLLLDKDLDKLDAHDKEKEKSKSPSVEKDTSISSDAKTAIDEKGKDKRDDRSKSPSAEKEIIKKEGSPEKSQDDLDSKKAKEDRSKSPSVKKETATGKESRSGSIVADSSKSPSVEKDIATGKESRAGSIVADRSKSPSIEKEKDTKELSPEKTVVTEDVIHAVADSTVDASHDQSKSPSVEKELSKKEESPEKTLLVENVDAIQDRSKSPRVEKDVSKKEPTPEKVLASEDLSQAVHDTIADAVRDKSKSPSVEKETDKKEPSPEKVILSEDIKHEVEEKVTETRDDKSKSPSVKKESSTEEPSPEKVLLPEDIKSALDDKVADELHDRSKSPSVEKETGKKEPSPEKSKSPSVERESDKKEPSPEKDLLSEDLHDHSKSPSVEKETEKKEPSPEKAVTSEDLKHVDEKIIDTAHDKSKSPSVEKEIKEKEPSPVDRSKSPSVEKETEKKEPSPEKVTSEDLKHVDEKVVDAAHDKSKSPSVEKEIKEKEPSPVDRSKSPSVEKESGKKEPSPEKAVTSEDLKHVDAAHDKSKSPSVEKEIKEQEPSPVDRSKSPGVEKEVDKKEPSPEKAVTSADLKHALDDKEIDVLHDKSKSPGVEKESESKEPSPEKSFKSKSPSVEKEIERKESSPVDRSKSPSVEKETVKKEPSLVQAVTSEDVKHALDEKETDVLHDKSKSPGVEKESESKEPSPEKSFIAEDVQHKIDAKIDDSSIDRSKSPSVEKETSRKESLATIDAKLTEESHDGSKSPSSEKDADKKEPSPEKTLTHDDMKHDLDDKVTEVSYDKSKSPSVEKETSRKESLATIDAKLTEESHGGSKSPSPEKDAHKKEPSPEKTLTHDDMKHDLDDKVTEVSHDKSKSPSVEKETSRKESLATIDAKLMEESHGGSKSPSPEKDAHKKEPSPEKTLTHDDMKHDLDDKVTEVSHDKSKSPSVEKETSRKESLATIDAKLTKESHGESKSPSPEKDAGRKEPSPEKTLTRDDMKHDLDGKVTEVSHDKSKSPSVEKEIEKKEPSPEKSLVSEDIKHVVDEKVTGAADIESKSPSVEKEIAKKEPSPEKTHVIEDLMEAVDEVMIDTLQDRSKSPSAEKETGEKEASPDKAVTSDDIKQSAEKKDTQAPHDKSKSPSVEKEMEKKEPSLEKSLISEDIDHVDEKVTGASNIRSKSPSVEKETTKKEPSPEKAHVFDDLIHALDDTADEKHNKSKSPSVEKETDKKEPSPEKVVLSEDMKHEVDEKVTGTPQDRSKSPSIEKELAKKEPSPEKLEAASHDASKSPSVEKETSHVNHARDDKSKSPSAERDTDQKEPSTEKVVSSEDINAQDDKIDKLHDKSKSPSVEKDTDKKEPSPEKSLISEDIKHKIDADSLVDKSKSPSPEKDVSVKEPSPEKALASEDVIQAVHTTTVDASHDRSKSPSVEKETDKKEPSPEKVITLDEIKHEAEDKTAKDSHDKSKSPSVEKDLGKKEPSPEKSLLSDDLKSAVDEKVAEEHDRSKSPNVEKETDKKESSPEKDHETKDAQDRSKSPSVEKESEKKEPSIDRSKSPSVEKDTSKKETSPEKEITSGGVKHDVDEKLIENVHDKSKSPNLEKEISQKEPSPEKEVSHEKSKSPSVEKETDKKDPSPEKALVSEDIKLVDESTVNASHDRSKSPSVEKEASKKESSPEKSDTSDGIVADVTRDKSKSPSAEKELEKKEPSPEKSLVSEDIKHTVDAKVTDVLDVRSKSPSVEKDPTKKEPTQRSHVIEDLIHAVDDVIIGVSQDRSKSPSVDKETGKKEASPEKVVIAEGAKHEVDEKIADIHDKSKSPSVEKEIEKKESSPEKSLIAEGIKSVVDEVTEGLDRSKSPSVEKETSKKETSPEKSIVSEVSKKDEDAAVVKAASEGSKSPSVEKETTQSASDKAVTESTTDRSKSPSVVESDKKEPSPDKSSASEDLKHSKDGVVSESLADKFKSPSMEREVVKKEMSPEKSIIPEHTADEKSAVTTDAKSKSPSIEREIVKKEMSPEKSIIPEHTADEKSAVTTDAKSKSPSVEKDTALKSGVDSRSGSVSSERGIGYLASQTVLDTGGLQKSLIDIQDDFIQKDDKLLDKLVSSSISEKVDGADKSASTGDREKSASPHSDKSDVKSEIDRSHRTKSPSLEKEILSSTIPHSEQKDESSSIEKIDDSLQSRLSITSDKIEGYSIDKTESSSIVNDKQDILDKPQSPSNKDQKHPSEDLVEKSLSKSRSSSISESKHQIEDKLEKSRSPSLVGSQTTERHDFDKSKSVSPVSERSRADVSLHESSDVRKASITSVGSHVEDKGKDRSRSHSLFETGDKTPLVRSRAASLYEDKLVEKLGILDNVKDSLGHTDDIFEEQDELRLSHETLDELQKDVFKRDTEAEDYSSPDTKEVITDYLLHEYINKKIIITLHDISEISNFYKVDRHIIMKIIDEIIDNLKVKRYTIIVLDEEEYADAADAAQKVLDDEENLIHYITDEFVAKKKKINSKMVDEIASTKSVSRQLVVVVIENIITSRSLRRESIVDADFSDSEESFQKEPEVDLKSTGTSRKESFSEKLSDTPQHLKDISIPAKSISPSPEPDSLITSKSDRPEPHIDEEIIISENKRIEVETLLMDNYVIRGIKITENILEQISLKTSLPKYIIIEIIEEILIKKHLSRDAIADKAIFHDDDFDDAQMKLDYERESLTGSAEHKPSGYSTPDTQQYEDRLEKSMPYTDYESPFHKAFMGGMTEIRTTHITTLSGKSTPDFGLREGTPDSSSEITNTMTTTITRVPETFDKTSDHKPEIASQVQAGKSAEDTVVVLKTTQITTYPETSAEITKEVTKQETVSGSTSSKIATEEEIDNITKVMRSTVMSILGDDKGHESSEVITTTTTKTITSETEIDPISLLGSFKIDDLPQTSTHLEKMTTITTTSDTDGKITAGPASIDEKLISLDTHDKSPTDIKSKDHTQMSFMGKDLMDHTAPEQLEQSVFPLIKDLITDERSYSGKSSPDVSLPKDLAYGGSTGKSTPDISMSPLIRDSNIMQSHLSGRSTPDKRSDNRSRTATPEGFRSGDVIRTIITTTRTMSDDGDIITTTREVTEATNDKGETVVITEKTDVKVDDRLPETYMSETKPIDIQRTTSPGSDIADRDMDPTSPRSDLSSGHSRAATHMWGSSEERHTYSDEEQSSPQFSPHHPDPRLPAMKESSKTADDFSSAAMSSSFYGELPDEPIHFSSSITKTTESLPESDEYSFKKFMVEKEYAGGYTDTKGSKKYIDEADLDFEKALTGFKDDKGDHEGSQESSSSVLRASTQELSGTSPSKSTDADGKKDPLAGWGSPLGLPSPKAPRKFNLRSPIQPTSSADLSPDSLNFDVINDWGEPMRLPSPAPATNEVSNKGSPGTPKKEKKQAKKVISENIKNKKRSESPSKNDKRTKDSKNKVQPVYVDLTYVSHHGNSFYTALEFFKKVRARYYVFSGTEPSREVYDALLEAKKTWEDKDLEVTMIPTYDTDTLGYWVADNEEALAAHHIDLSPSASRCTINLQDHETSCSAYRLEF